MCADHFLLASCRETFLPESILLLRASWSETRCAAQSCELKSNCSSDLRMCSRSKAGTPNQALYSWGVRALLTTSDCDCGGKTRDAETLSCMPCVSALWNSGMSSRDLSVVFDQGNVGAKRPGQRERVLSTPLSTTLSGALTPCELVDALQKEGCDLTRIATAQPAKPAQSGCCNCETSFPRTSNLALSSTAVLPC